VKRINNIFLIPFIFLALSACTGNTASDSSDGQTNENNPYGGFEIPAPTADEIILTVIGDSTVNFSLNNLRALPKVSIEIEEPFILERQSFEGVYLSELFKSAGISPSEIVDTIATNEYRYQDQAKALSDAKAILAYSVDGGLIDMDKGGPIRLVFDEDSEYFDFLDAWNWSLREISVATD
jgi:hypothetical protein